MRTGTHLFPNKVLAKAANAMELVAYGLGLLGQKKPDSRQGKPSSYPIAGSAQLEGHGLSPQAV